MQDEDNWVSKQRGSIPTEAEYKKYHEHILTPYAREGFRNGAVQVLEGFAAQAIQAEKTDLLRYHRKFRYAGIAEAILGAFLWTLLLIVLTIVATRTGIDILEYYKRAAGLPH
jgi:hypothetical protein